MTQQPGPADDRLDLARDRAARGVVEAYALPLPVALRALGSIPFTLGVLLVLIGVTTDSTADDGSSATTTRVVAVVLGLLLVGGGAWLMSTAFRHSWRQVTHLGRLLADVRAARAEAPDGAGGPGVLRRTVAVAGWQLGLYLLVCLASAVYFIARLLA